LHERVTNRRRTGDPSVPLLRHGARRLFERIVVPSREILAHLVAKFGAKDVLRRLSDPVTPLPKIAPPIQSDKATVHLC
jgi:hypothetical protein